MDFNLWMIGALGVGSALGGSFATGEPVYAVLTSLQGSVGVVVGYGIAGFVAPMLDNIKTDKTGHVSREPSSLAPYLPWMGAAVVPLVAGGVVDRGLIGLLAGAKIATFLVPQ